MTDYIELCNRLTIIANEYAKRGQNDVSDTLYEASDTIYCLGSEKRSMGDLDGFASWVAKEVYGKDFKARPFSFQKTAKLMLKRIGKEPKQLVE